MAELNDKASQQRQIRSEFYLELYSYIYENNIYENFKTKFTEEKAYDTLSDEERFKLFKLANKLRKDDKAKKALYNKLVLEHKLRIKPVFKDCAWYGLCLGNTQFDLRKNLEYLSKIQTSVGSMEVVEGLLDKAMTMDLSLFANNDIYSYLGAYEKNPLFFRAMRFIQNMVNCEAYQMSEKFTEFFKYNYLLIRKIGYVGKIVDVYGNPLSIYFPEDVTSEELATIANNLKIENIINKYHDAGLDYSEMLEFGVEDKCLASYCAKFINLKKNEVFIKGFKALADNTVSLNGLISQKYFTNTDNVQIESIDAIRIFGTGENIDTVLINDYTSGEIALIDRNKLGEYDKMINYCNEIKSHIQELTAKMRQTEMRFFPSKNEYFMKIKNAMSTLEACLNCDKKLEDMGKNAADLYRALIAMSSVCKEYVDITEGLKKDDRHQARFDIAKEFIEFIDIKEIKKLMYLS